MKKSQSSLSWCGLVLALTLSSLLVTGTSHAAITSKKAVIFDLDDTLFNTNYRTLQILQEIGVSEGIAALQTLEFEQVNYFCGVTLKNVGITDAALQEKICGQFDSDPKKNTIASSLWGSKFFKDPNYLAYDHIIPGAPQFVDKIMRSTNSQVIYLTARSQDALKSGTIQQLRHCSFPGFRGDFKDRTVLIMKPSSHMGDDVSFKKNILQSLIDQGIQVGCAFDDSVSNANMFREVLPSSAPVIRPALNVLDLAKVSPGIAQITTYFYNVSIKGGARSIEPNLTQLDEVIENCK